MCSYLSVLSPWTFQIEHREKVTALDWESNDHVSTSTLLLSEGPTVSHLVLHLLICKRSLIKQMTLKIHCSFIILWGSPLADPSTCPGFWYVCILTCTKSTTFDSHLHMGLWFPGFLVPTIYYRLLQHWLTQLQHLSLPKPSTLTLSELLSCHFNSITHAHTWVYKGLKSPLHSVYL